MREGEDGDALFVLLSGEAVIERGGKTVATLAPGDYFGELALLDPAPRAATVTATTDTELAVLGVRMFRVLLRELPPLGAKLLADLAQRVRQAGAPDPAERFGNRGSGIGDRASWVSTGRVRGVR